MSNVVVGPVVGKVTSGSARVLLEVDSADPVDLVLTGGDAEAHQRRLGQKANRPRVIEFVGLTPETDYKIEIDGATPQKGVQGRVRTLAEQPNQLRVAIVSCNKPDSDRRDDLWKSLDEQAGDFDYTFHLGDQIYGDGAFAYGRSLLGPGEHKRRRISAKIRLEIEEAFRALYRTSWTWDHTARFLARTPNLMIWDDHEIRDDWGSRPNHHMTADGDHPEMVVGKIARDIYREYQHQLYESVTGDLGDDESHIHTFGPYGVVFVDQRGGRSFGDTPEERAIQERIANVSDRSPYLGSAQWAKLEAAFAPDGDLESVRCLVLATSVPLVYLTETFGQDGGGEEFFANDLADHWSNGQHRHEQLRMLRLLTAWRKAGEGDREVLVIGGDVHVGGHTNITSKQGKDDQVLHQLITSPVTNRPPRVWEFPFLRAILELQRSVEGEFRVDHHNFTNSRNYGRVTMAAGGQGTPPTIESVLIVED